VEIITANDAAKALHILHTVVPDVVVVDAFLPSLDGFQICQIVRETIGLQHTPVILLTSNFTPYDHAKGERVGVTAHLAKPFEAHALRQLIQQLVELPAPAAEPQARAPSPMAMPAAPSQVATAPSPAPQRLSTEPVPAGSSMPPQAPDELTSIIAQWTPGLLNPPPSSTMSLEQALGQALLQIARDLLQQHLTTMVEQLAPQILASVQAMVNTQATELLEVLLQREIDKLKRIVEDDSQDQAQDR
jgi:CheY-like chemotaxis protein